MSYKLEYKFTPSVVVKTLKSQKVPEAKSHALIWVCMSEPVLFCYGILDVIKDINTTSSL
jgi:hypothetical protein